MRHLAAAIVDSSGMAWPGVCGRWLAYPSPGWPAGESDSDGGQGDRLGMATPRPVMHGPVKGKARLAPCNPRCGRPGSFQRFPWRSSLCRVARTGRSRSPVAARLPISLPGRSRQCPITCRPAQACPRWFVSGVTAGGRGELRAYVRVPACWCTEWCLAVSALQAARSWVMACCRVACEVA